MNIWEHSLILESRKLLSDLLRLMLVHVSSWETFRKDSKIEVTALLSLGKVTYETIL